MDTTATFDITHTHTHIYIRLKDTCNILRYNNTIILDLFFVEIIAVDHL